MTKLKPCPFCGGKHIRICRIMDLTCYPVKYQGQCLHCGVTGGYLQDTRKIAIKLWNKRVSKGLDDSFAASGKADVSSPDWFKQKSVDDTETETVHRFIGE